ncbi:hypothetical protein A8C56_19355 [Niabella ginsenosidivorans]|uniref:RNA polymerase subunit sigma-24 n=1 Tax=Niabella ginsenosidivorans TaxID=1176587 RepID=A0A1A9I8J3_9BACT|nr:RNA polymerase sigma factor [Niabella ginsenosidivorans]ANH82854.1 hypothetical protein A8C56_19355 [Niabella ginsenosidivorans]
MPVKDIKDDYHLWQSLKEGKQEALASIYFNHFKSLYEYGLRITGDEELVKDTIQDLFIKIWTNRSNFENISKIRPYLLVSLRSALYNKIQQNGKRPVRALNTKDEFEMVFSAESKYIAGEARSLQTQKLLAALNQLTPKQKEIIYLRYFEELDYEEIVRVMNSSLKAVYKLKARGLDALKQLLHLSDILLIVLLASCCCEICA